MSPVKDKDELLERFDTYFEAVSADTPALLETALALRYQVYCLERKFEDASQHRDGREKDAFDRRSRHGLLIHKPQGEAIGTARLILPEPRTDSLPIQQLLRRTGLRATDYFPADTAAEVSRFAISKDFRRRSLENSKNPVAGPVQTERRSSLPALGLLQILLRQSIDLGISYWTAVMEPQLLRMWAAMGIRLETIGPLVSHHGLRQPCYCYIPQMLETLAQARPEHWAVMTNGGELTRCAVTRSSARFVA